MSLEALEIRCQNCFTKNRLYISEITQGTDYTCICCEDAISSESAIVRKALQKMRNEKERIEQSYLSPLS
jgi:hypothetical protein